MASYGSHVVRDKTLTFRAARERLGISFERLRKLIDGGALAVYREPGTTRDRVILASIEAYESAVRRDIESALQAHQEAHA